jgi:uncharacterized membrane-anchored protein
LPTVFSAKGGVFQRSLDMKKYLALALLGLALAGSVATITTLAPQPALADGGSCNNC